MYRAPLREFAFLLEELLDTAALSALPPYEEYSAELATAVLGEAARFAETVLEPLNRSGDEEGAHWSPDGVTAPAGFKEAYLQFVEAGWPQLGQAREQGGQGAPLVLATAVQEIWASANLAFKLCPMLTHGAAHALELTGSREQRRL